MESRLPPAYHADELETPTLRNFRPAVNRQKRHHLNVYRYLLLPICGPRYTSIPVRGHQRHATEDQKGSSKYRRLERCLILRDEFDGVFGIYLAGDLLGQVKTLKKLVKV